MIRLAAVVCRLRLDLGGLRVAVPLFVLVLSWPLWGSHLVKHLRNDDGQSAAMVGGFSTHRKTLEVAPVGFTEYINDQYPATHFDTYAQRETPRPH